MHTCNATSTPVGDVNLAICSVCGSYAWTDQHGAKLDAAEGMASAYGPFSLAGRLRSIGTPGGEALIYRVPRRYRSRLGALTVGRWVEIYPDLYASQDGTNLLLAPADPLLSRNLLAIG